MEHGLVADIGICIIAAWVVAVVSHAMRLPLLLAYLAAGFAIGPYGFKWVTDVRDIAIISEIGLSLLLFMIGLEIDLKKMLSAGKVITVTAAVQVLGCVLLGWLVFCFIGPAENRLEALYLAVAAAMSSTIIIVKILYDKRELETLAGRITLGVLVIQDLFAILFLAIQPTLTEPALGPMALSLFKVVVLVATALVAGRYALPPLFRAVARLPELVLVGALAWCFLVCGLAEALQLSREMGALIAGVVLSTFPYALAVTAKVTTLRDFFLTLFFVALGMSIPRPDAHMLLWACAYSAFLVGSRLATVFLPLHWMRLGHRASLLPAVNLCQVSEFSLVVVALGAKAGHVSKLTEGVVAYAFAFLAINSSYAIVRNDDALRWLSSWLRKLGIRDLDQGAALPAEGHGNGARQIQILGFFRTASSLLEELGRRAPELLREVSVVDFNPHVNEELRRRGIPVTYGDISQRATLLHAGVDQACIILCTIPNALLKGTDNLRLVQQLRELNPAARIIAHADLIEDIPKLYAAGADYVSVPRLVEARELCGIVQAAREDQLDAKRRSSQLQFGGRREIIR